MATPAPSPERQRLDQLVAIVTRNLDAFIQAGEALATIRNEKLHRLTHASFADFVQERWGMTARRAYQLIAAADVVENVKCISHIPSDAQARELAKLPAGDQAQVWTEALETHDDAPTVADVAAAVARRRPSRKNARKAPKPIRLKTPGGIVIIEPRKHDADLMEIMKHAAQILADQLRKQHAA